MEIKKNDAVQLVYTYDAVGNILSVTDGSGNTTTYTYDSMSRLSTVTAFGSTTTYTYDNSNNRVLTHYGNNAEITCSYDSNNRVTMVEGKTNVDAIIYWYHYTYDNNNRILTKKFDNDDSKVESYEYDAAGRVQTCHALNYTSEYFYDNAGNRTGLYTSYHQSMYSGYDLQNVPVNYDEKYVSYEYSSVNRLASERESMRDSEGAEVVGTKTVYTFDLRGNLQKEEFYANVVGGTAPQGEAEPQNGNEAENGSGGETGESGTGGAGSGESAQPTPEANPEATPENTPAPEETAAIPTLEATVEAETTATPETQQPDSGAGAVDQLPADATGGGLLVSYITGNTPVYGGSGQNAEQAGDDSVPEQGPSSAPMDETVSEGQAEASPEVEQTTETAPTAEPVPEPAPEATPENTVPNDSEPESQNGEQGGGQNSEPSNEPEATPVPTPSVQPVTEQTSASRTAAWTAIQALADSVFAGEKQSETVYTYDSYNRLTSVSVGGEQTSYQYNGDDVRVATVRGGSVVYQLVDRGYVIKQTVVTGEEQQSVSYVRGLGYISRQAGAHTSYYFDNGQGDVVQTRDAAGNAENRYEYDIFGEATLCIEAYENPFRYRGEQYDSETGNIYLRSRYYSPTQGRFLTQDSFAGIQSKPNTLNLYAYCGNDPVNNIDLSGHLFEGPGWDAYLEANMNNPDAFYYDLIREIKYIEAEWRAREKMGDDGGPSYYPRLAEETETQFNIITGNAADKNYVAKKNNVDLLVAQEMINTDMKFGSNKYGTFDFEGHPKPEVSSNDDTSDETIKLLYSILGGVDGSEVDPELLRALLDNLDKGSSNTLDSLSEDEVAVRIKDKTTKGIIIDDRTYLKIRDLGEALGGIVDYDEKTNTATITVNGQKIIITTDGNTGQQVVKLNGKTVDAEVKLVNGSNYIPLRKISNLLGIDDKDIVWDGKKRTAFVQRRGLYASGEKEQKVLLDSVTYLTGSKGFYFDIAGYLAYDASREDADFEPTSPTSMILFQLVVNMPAQANVSLVPDKTMMGDFIMPGGGTVVEGAGDGEYNFYINKDNYIDGFVTGSSIGKNKTQLSVKFETFLPHEIIHLLRYAYGSADIQEISTNNKEAIAIEEAWAIYVQNQVIKELNDAVNANIPYRYDGSSMIPIPDSTDYGNGSYGSFPNRDVEIPDATDIEEILKKKV